MDHVLQDLDPVVILVQQQHSAPSNLLSLHHRLEVSQEAHVFRHVGSQDLRANIIILISAESTIVLPCQ